MYIRYIANDSFERYFVNVQVTIHMNSNEPKPFGTFFFAYRSRPKLMIASNDVRKPSSTVRLAMSCTLSIYACIASDTGRLILRSLFFIRVATVVTNKVNEHSNDVKRSSRT